MTETTTVQIPYPTDRFSRALYRMPVALYRLGLGPVIPGLFTVLTAPGRKSGRIYHTPLECRMMGDSLWVISGWGERAHWYQNVRANPIVTLQHRGQEFAAKATVIEDPDERVIVVDRFARTMGQEAFDQVYGRMLGLPANADGDMRRKLYSRVAPVRFDRLRNQPPPFAGVRPDLLWVWPALGAAFLIGWYWSSRSKRE